MSVETQEHIQAVCSELSDMLVEKNRKYGDSALNPIRIFSRASAKEQILVRLDDKLSRLRSQQADEDEDVISDLIGYLILLKIAVRRDDADEGATEQVCREGWVRREPKKYIPGKARAFRQDGGGGDSPSDFGETK